MRRAAERGGPVRSMFALVAVICFGACAPEDAPEAQAGNGPAAQAFAFETVNFAASDGLEVTADLYRGASPSAPTVILFHQSASSRGEYRQVAPRLQLLGYNALAVDLRWGRSWSDVDNVTAQRNGTDSVMTAVEAGIGSPRSTIDASWMDMMAAVEWARGQFPDASIHAVGSSFSAMLVTRLAAEGDVASVTAFSPAEYDDSRPELVRGWAERAAVPMLSVAAVDEGEMVRVVSDAVPEDLRHFHQAAVGRHGASIMDEDDANFGVLAAFVGHVSGGPPARDEMRVPGPAGDLFVDRYDGPGEGRVIALFHQGGGSARGEYGFLVADLLREGFDVVAADLQGGGDRFGFPNRTLQAHPEPADFTYCDALPEMMAVLEAARAWKPGAELIGWGSSYSGALILHAATSVEMSRVLAFSPASGEPLAGCEASTVADQLTLPVLVLRPEGEAAIESVASQLEIFDAAGHATFVASPGVHASSMLNPFRVRGDVGATTARVTEFLGGG